MIRNTEVLQSNYTSYTKHSDKQFCFIMVLTFHEQMPVLQWSTEKLQMWLWSREPE